MYSIFDIFKVSIGPSSSHTMGPMIAGKHFRDLIIKKSLQSEIDRIDIKLFGSLAFTGKAHGTDKGIILGLSGYCPEKVTSKDIKKTILTVKKTNTIKITLNNSIPFYENKNIKFDTKKIPTKYSNTLEINGYKNFMF